MVQNLEFSVHRRWLPYCSAFGDIGIDHEGSDLTELEVAVFFLELYDSTSRRRLASIVYFSLFKIQEGKFIEQTSRDLPFIQKLALCNLDFRLPTTVSAQRRAV